MILLIIKFKKTRYIRILKSRKNVKSFIQINIKKVCLIIESNIVKKINRLIQID